MAFLAALSLARVSPPHHVTFFTSSGEGQVASEKPMAAAIKAIPSKEEDLKRSLPQGSEFGRRGSTSS